LAEIGGQQPGDITLITLPLHHFAGVRSLWDAHTKGNVAVLMRRFDPEEALRLIDRHKITVWSAVPTMYKRIAGLPTETLQKYDVRSIRLLRVGAAPVPGTL